MKGFGGALIGASVLLVGPGGWRSLLAAVLLTLAVLMISDREGK